MNNYPLSQFGNVPVDVTELGACFSHLASPSEKIRSLERTGYLIRLKRGLYVQNQDNSGKDIDVCLCANHIYGPSYVSFSWALRWYGLIPEQVYILTSATTKHSRTFENSIGSFSYYKVPKEYFPIGVTNKDGEESTCMIATPEKALCDTILHNSYVPYQSISSLRTYLEEDLRIDMDMLKDFNTMILEECAGCGVKTSIFRNLIKIIKK